MCSDDNISTLQTGLYSPGLPEMMSWGERFRMWFITCYSFQAGIISLIMTRKPSLLRWSRRRQDPAHCLVLFIRLTQTQRLQKDCLCVSIERKRLFMVCTIASFCSLLGSNGHARRFPVHAVSRYLSYCVFYDTVPAANWLNHAKGKKKKKKVLTCASAGQSRAPNPATRCRSRWAWKGSTGNSRWRVTIGWWLLPNKHVHTWACSTLMMF